MLAVLKRGLAINHSMIQRHNIFNLTTKVLLFCNMACTCCAKRLINKGNGAIFAISRLYLLPLLLQSNLYTHLD